MELDGNIHKEIKKHCAAGDRLAGKKQFTDAIAEYEKAWVLLPEPKNSWDASEWIYTAIGDAYFLSGDFDRSRHFFQQAYNGNPSNPFIMLRLGQSLFELNDTDKAEDHLLGAYMMEGKKIFKGEDKKYLAHMSSKYSL